MKSVFLTIIAASLLFSFANPQELQSQCSSGDGFTTLEKPRIGGF
ncbi:hypothetical protein P4475_16140 [Halalkalibacterium halodurans]|nr:hypothetical protein [Halalkalibacterium halodurans]MED4126469.1 hypothetical protein [Halalkalibacterium halodurans]